MNVNLTPELADYVQSELSNGDYASASEVVRDALRLMRRDRALDEAKLQLLREAIQVGIDEADRGEVSELSVDDVLREVRAGRDH